MSHIINTYGWGLLRTDVAVCGAPPHSKTICNLKCIIFHTHTHTYTLRWWAKSVQFLWCSRRKNGNKFVYRKNVISCVFDLNETDTCTFWCSPCLAIMRACSSIVSEISKWLWIWSRYKKRYGSFLAYTNTHPNGMEWTSKKTSRSERRLIPRSDHSLKRWNLVRAAIFFPLHGSLVWFCSSSSSSVFLHISTNTNTYARSSQTSLSFRFSVYRTRRMPTALVFTNHHYSYSVSYRSFSLSRYLFPSFSNTRSFRMRRPSTQPSTGPVMCK